MISLEKVNRFSVKLFSSFNSELFMEKIIANNVRYFLQEVDLKERKVLEE